MSDTNYPAGWYDDPLGRGDLRYYDGSVWTDQIRIGDISQSDPLEAPAPVESATPFDPSQDVTAVIAPGTNPAMSDPQQGAHAAPVAASVAPTAAPTVAPAESSPAASAQSFIDSLGDLARRRETADLPLALGGVGGALVGIGLVVLIGQSGSRGAILGGAIAALAVALLAAFKFLGDQPWLRTAATACASAGLFALGGGLILAGETSDNSPGLFLLLVGVLHLVAWVAPGFRGRPFMLGGGLIATSFGLALLVAGGRCEDDFFGGSGCNFAEDAASQVGLSTGAGAVLLVIGVGLLFGLRKLDGDGYHGVAATVAAAAIVTNIGGAGALSIDLGSTANSLFVIVVGLGLGIIGHQGARQAGVIDARRALTWTGAAMVAAGVVSLVTNLVTADDATTAGIIIVLLGAALIAIPRFVQIQAANREQQEAAMPSGA